MQKNNKVFLSIDTEMIQETAECSFDRTLTEKELGRIHSSIFDNPEFFEIIDEAIRLLIECITDDNYTESEIIDASNQSGISNTCENC